MRNTNSRRYYTELLKYIGIIVALMLVCKFSKGFAAVPIVLMGVVWAFQGQSGKALCCYVLLPLFVVFNPLIIPITTPMVLSNRLGLLAMGLAMVISSANRSGQYRLPLGGLAVYMLVVTISSFSGYCPKVSLFKIINYSVFLVGLWFGTQNLHRKPKDMELLRKFFLAMCAVTVFGGLMALPFPAIAYSVSSQYLVRQYGVEVANQMMKANASGGLFSGITCQSQALAPLLTVMVAFVLSDMFFVEKKMEPFHVVLTGGIFISSFLTRSRTGLFSITIASLMVCFFASPNLKMSQKLKRRINNAIFTFIIVISVCAIIMEVKNRTFTRWVRKTDKIETDDRSFSEALTSTRMGAVEELMGDFKKNPLLGCGFQVNADSARFNDVGFVLFAPVEKGLLPLVVLGEGGALGALIFYLFIASFIAICVKKKMFITASTFVGMLATNIGEATFFSPGGIGGILWMYGAISGFTLDMYLIGMKQRERRMLVPVFMPRMYLHR